MTNVIIYSTTAAGILMLFLAMFYGHFLKSFDINRDLTGTASKEVVSEQSGIKYNAKVKNTLSTPIRLCGGQLNWCGQGGCYKVTTPFPMTVEPGQEAAITVSISPREEKLSETELILYADGKGLDGLTSIKIKLPAVSFKPL